MANRGTLSIVDQTHYDILAISPLATAAEIKSAYHEAVRDCHPDKSVRHESSKDSTRKFLQIQSAWECLRDTEAKRIYDERLLLCRTKLKARMGNAVKLELNDCYDSPELAFDEETGNNVLVFTFRCRCGESLEVVMDENASSMNDRIKVIDCYSCSLTYDVSGLAKAHDKIWG